MTVDTTTTDLTPAQRNLDAIRLTVRLRRELYAAHDSVTRLMSGEPASPPRAQFPIMVLPASVSAMREDLLARLLALIEETRTIERILTTEIAPEMQTVTRVEYTLWRQNYHFEKRARWEGSAIFEKVKVYDETWTVVASGLNLYDLQLASRRYGYGRHWKIAPSDADQDAYMPGLNSPQTKAQYYGNEE